MNKREITKQMVEIRKLFNYNNNFNPNKTIYIVKCKLLHHNVAAKIAINTTYNLFTFQDLDTAKEYIELFFNNIITDELKTFSVLVPEISSDDPSDGVEEDGNTVIYKKSIKLSGKDSNKCHTKLYTFTIETVDFI